ncbi:hypothetical protein J2X01_000290 [Arthrobacter ginsengisoli]|uniref:Tail sheath protein C-terminal domain-containing protein n=1 Tax=Arthrobacter ginsengisoli TaxID=1356565 RepID=A0ABU1U763_9MICC|nr:hypothetical protein [Arthrobacter ginsengisoli]
MPAQPAHVEPTIPPGTAFCQLSPPDSSTPVLTLTAANEGSWGNQLEVRLSFDAGQSFDCRLVTGPGEQQMLVLPAGIALTSGTLLSLRVPGGANAEALRWAEPDTVIDGRTGIGIAAAILATPLTDLAAGSRLAATEITATLTVRDHDPAFGREERLPRLGLHPAHPRWIATVLHRESELVRLHAPLPGPVLPPDGRLAGLSSRGAPTGGIDRWEAITIRSFFDDPSVDSDPLDEHCHRGVNALSRSDDVGILAVPDITWSWAVDAPPPEPPPRRWLPRAVQSCAPGTAPPAEPVPPPAAHLDPRVPGQLAELARRQQRLVAIAEVRKRFVVVLDAPLGLGIAGLLSWRAEFDSSFAAAYHPWLRVSAPADRGRTVLVPPSAFAAGILAARERRRGLIWGPANELAAGAVTSSDPSAAANADRLHLSAINTFVPERDGLRLTGARTLSADPAYRQLSIRRFMTMLALSIERECNWVVFETNNISLRLALRNNLTNFLTGLFRQGAFAGASERDSFFVHCDEVLNSTSSLAGGFLLAEVGVAPAAPLEYLVLRVAQDSGGLLEVEEKRG